MKEQVLKAMREAGKPVSAGDVTKALKEKTPFGLIFGFYYAVYQLIKRLFVCLRVAWYALRQQQTNNGPHIFSNRQSLHISISFYIFDRTIAYLN